MLQKGEILIYQSESGDTRIDVYFEAPPPTYIEAVPVTEKLPICFLPFFISSRMVIVFPTPRNLSIQSDLILTCSNPSRS